MTKPLFRHSLFLVLSFTSLCVAEPTPEAAVVAARLKQFAEGQKPAEKKLVFVYFTPADREPPPNYRVRLARVMTDIQGFYGREMERHGLGGRGIRFDLDAKGALVMHDVKGKHSAGHYLGRDHRKGYEIKAEARPVLAAAGIDDENETVIYFCHLRTEQDGRTTGIGPYYGSGAQEGVFRPGRCWFTDATILDPDLLSDKTTMLNDEEYSRISAGRYNSIFIGGAAHELGHGLGLPHDKERKDERVRGTSLMGSGNRTYGEERRGEGLGSFLTLADALRLASHPIFSGTLRDIEVKPECRLEELSATVLPDGKLEITGHVNATPRPYAVIAYHDPFGGPVVDAKGWHDYASTTWTAVLDGNDRFSVSVGEFQPGGANIRFVVCHLNGATSGFRYPLQVKDDGKPDAAGMFAEKNRAVTKISSKDGTALVDTNDAPDLKEWGNKAGTLCVEWFPKIAALLPSDGFIAPKEVTLYFDPKMKGVAHASGGRITISAEFVRAHHDDLGMVVHEVTHVVQSYPPGGPGWLVEGIADYIRIVHFEPQAPRPKLNPHTASYKDAYKTTAMFLEWVEKNHAADLVVRMNAALRKGEYNETLWKTLTSKTVDELWKSFADSLTKDRRP